MVQSVCVVFPELKTINVGDSKGQSNGTIPDIRNNNTVEEEEQKSDCQHCLLCSTATSQRAINSINTNSTTTADSTPNSVDNFQHASDQLKTTMIDDPPPAIINSDSLKTKSSVNTIDQEFSSFPAIVDHPGTSPDEKCLLPVVEDSDSSGS